MFFNMFQLENEVTPVGKMTQSTYLCVILHVKHKSYQFFLFLGDFYFWVKSKMATIFGDVKGLQQHHHQ